MKRILKITAVALLMVLGGSLRNTASAQYNQDDPYYDQNDQYSNDQNGNDRDVSYQTFYDELSPHGRWVDYPGQGYVWIPDAGPDFRPYSTNGHWVWSDNYEWMWVSDYDWGWAPFHYGRWDNDPSYGWYWVPGYEWSPAWVAWRDGGDYYGWAPIRPGINISINFNIGGYTPPVDFWCFTPRRYITSPRVYDYCVPFRQNVTIINYTNIIVNNYHYGNSYGFRSGPRRYDAERYTGRINPVRFRQSNTPGRSTFRNNEVSIYRPNVRRDNGNRNIAPRNVERFDRNNNNNNGFRRNDVANNNGNTPGRGQGNDNNRFERRNGDTRQQNNNGNPNNLPNNRRFERNDNNTNQPGNTQRRVFNPSDRPERNTNPANNGNTDPRRLERRNNNNGNNNNPANNSNNDPRRFERRQVQPQQQQQQPQQQQRQFERRQPQPQQQRQVQPQQQQQPRQMERRQESRPQPQQQQQRSAEKRGDGNNGAGNGKGRRF